MKSSKDEMRNLVHTCKKHPGTIQFELAEGRNISQHLDSGRSHRKSTCIKYNRTAVNLKVRGFFVCWSSFLNQEQMHANLYKGKEATYFQSHQTRNGIRW